VIVICKWQGKENFIGKAKCKEQSLLSKLNTSKVKAESEFHWLRTGDFHVG